MGGAARREAQALLEQNAKSNQQPLVLAQARTQLVTASIRKTLLDSRFRGKERS
jgi:hypothetical protein